MMQAADDRSCLFDTLKYKNSGTTLLLLHDIKKSKSTNAFLYLKSIFSNKI